MYKCMHACIHVCLHACIGLGTFSNMYICVYVCIYVCACVHVCTFCNTPPQVLKVASLALHPPPLILKSFLCLWVLVRKSLCELTLLNFSNNRIKGEDVVPVKCI